MTAPQSMEAVDPVLRQLTASLADPGESGPSLVFSSGRSFDLLLEGDLPATVRLHPDGQSVAVDLWCGQAQEDDTPRRLLVELLLGLNLRHLASPDRWVGLDSRDFVLVHGRMPIDALAPAGLAGWLEGIAAEARQVRSLVDPWLE